MTLPVPLYVPNLLGYARILLAFAGLHFSATNSRLAVSIWIVSASLDLIDGILARALNQTSSLGILLDIAADNILRTTTWIAAAVADPSHQLIACLVVSLEWTTMISTQLHATQSGSHWKSTREEDPWFLKAIFANNFRTPLGTWCIYGLFCSGLFVYASQKTELIEMLPYFHWWKYLAYFGRGISAIVEVWMIRGYLSLVVEKDNAESVKRKK